MLVYKALYKKIMDALKDAGMWIDWADQLQNEYPDLAAYLYDSAKKRLEDDYMRSYEWFKKLCDSDKERNGSCINNMVEEHICEWRDSMLSRLKKHTK